MKTIKLLPLLLTISALERGRGRDFAEGSFHSLGIVGFKSFVDGVLTPLGVLPQGFIRYRIMLGHGSLSPRSHRFILLHLGVRSNLNPPPLHPQLRNSQPMKTRLLLTLLLTLISHPLMLAFGNDLTPGKDHRWEGGVREIASGLPTLGWLPAGERNSVPFRTHRFSALIWPRPAFLGFPRRVVGGEKSTPIVQPKPLYGVVPNPRLFVHQFTPYADMARVRRELDLAVELGFGGIRTEWGTKELLNADNTFGNTWSQLKVIDPFLQELKTRNLGLHVTFGAQRVGASLEQESVFFRYVMSKSVEVLGASKVSWSVANEPQAWVTRGDDGYIRARALALIGIWDSMGVRDRGAWLYGPTLPGWDHWDFSQPVLAVQEGHRRILRLEWVYNPEGLQRSYMRRLGFASSFYAPAWNHDATKFTEEVAGSIVRILRKDYTPNPIFWTEANVRFEQWASDHYRGLKQAAICKALLSLDPNSKACAYVLAGHTGMEFATAAGVRNEERIKGFKELMTR
jgi:hypothetical protein